MFCSASKTSFLNATVSLTALVIFHSFLQWGLSSYLMPSAFLHEPLLHADTQHPNTSTSDSCHFAFPPCRDRLHAAPQRSARHSQAHHLLIYVKALLTLAEAPAKNKLHRYYTVITTWSLQTFLLGLHSLPWPARFWKLPGSQCTPMLNAHTPLAFNFLGLFQPAHVFRKSQWLQDNCFSGTATGSPDNPGENRQKEGQEPPEIHRGRGMTRRQGWAPLQHQYQQPIATGEKPQPWSEHECSDVRSCAGNSCFSPKSPLPQQGLAPQDSPCPSCRSSWSTRRPHNQQSRVT